MGGVTLVTPEHLGAQCSVIIVATRHLRAVVAVALDSAGPWSPARIARVVAIRRAGLAAGRGMRRGHRNLLSIAEDRAIILA